ncbi:MAG: hypothetical protein IJM06_04105 [Firmicutes bacterium]|nr:hypothetical protein [Bacillota bacterium]
MDFFDAVEFLREEEDFYNQPDFNEDNTGIKEEISLFAESFRNENAFKSQEIEEKTETGFGERAFLPEEDFSKGTFLSENYGDIQETSVNSIYGNIEKESGVFNSLEEVSSMENIDNSNKNTVINIDARSYNTISENIDLDAVSDYIADRLSDAVTSFTEVVHDV